MPPARSTQIAGPSRLPVIKLRPKPPRTKKAKPKAKPTSATPLVAVQETVPANDSGLFTPPEDIVADETRNIIISPPPEETFRMPLRPSLAVRLASEEPPFSMGSDSTFLGSPAKDSHKRKRNTSTLSPVPEPLNLVETTPNPKPRKQSRRKSRTRSLSPTPYSLANARDKTPTLTTPTRASPGLNQPNHTENSTTDDILPVPLRTRRSVATSSARRSATPVAYVPPTERFTSPEVVLLPAPPSQLKPRKSTRAGAPRLTLQVKREPPEIDLRAPPDPPSPSEDPLLLHPSSPRFEAQVGARRSSSRVPSHSPALTAPRDAPRFRSDTPPDAGPPHAVRSTSSSPPREAPHAAWVREDSRSPPSSDSDSLDGDAGAAFAFPTRGANGKGVLEDNWSDVEGSPLAKGEQEGEGEDEFTGKFTIVAVPTRADPPTLEEKERMDRWGRPISPFPGTPVPRRHSWLQDLEDGQAQKQAGSVEEPTTPSDKGGMDPRFDFGGVHSPKTTPGGVDPRFDFSSVPSPVFPRRSLLGKEPVTEGNSDALETAPHLADSPAHDVAPPSNAHSADAAHPAHAHSNDSSEVEEMSSYSFERNDNLNDSPDHGHENLVDASFVSYDEPLRDAEADASGELEQPSAASIDPFDFNTAHARSRSRSKGLEEPASPPREAAHTAADQSASTIKSDVPDKADETDESVNDELAELDAEISRRYSVAFEAIQRTQSEPLPDTSFGMLEGVDDEHRADESMEDNQVAVGKSPEQAFHASAARARSVEEEEDEQDSLYVDRALSKEPGSDVDEPSPRAKPSRRSSSRASASRRASSAPRSPERNLARKDSFEEMHAPGPSTGPARPIRAEYSFEMGEVEDPPASAVPWSNFPRPEVEEEDGMEVVTHEYHSSGSDTEEDVDPNLVTITSEDPKAAARAAAILKMYDYDCLPQILARRRRDSHATLDALLRSSRRKSLSASGVTKRAHTGSRARSVGGATGDKVVIPGSPAMTLPELLREAEVELEHDPSIIEQSPTKTLLEVGDSRAGSLAPDAQHGFILPDAPIRASSNPLMTPQRELIGLPPEFLRETPAPNALVRGPEDWTKEDWKAMDTCFTDERLDTAHRLGIPEGELADVDDVNLEDVVERFANTLYGGSAGWDRTMLLSRARALAKKQRAGKVAPATPIGSPQSSVVPFPSVRAVDMTPVRRALEKRPSMTLNDNGKIPASLRAPRYSHLLEEAIAISNDHHAAISSSPGGLSSVSAIYSVQDEAERGRATPPPEQAPMDPPQTITKRVKSWFTSFRSPTPKTTSLPEVTLNPVPNSAGYQPEATPLPQVALRPVPDTPEYEPAANVVERARPPIITPAPKEPPRAQPHRDLVDLEHVPTPAPKAAPPRKPQRLVELRPVSPPPPARQPVHLPRMRKDSGGSVKDLVRSFEDLEERSIVEAEARKRSEQVVRVRSIGRLRGAKGGPAGKPVWKP